jgi:hypothetical protein
MNERYGGTGSDEKLYALPYKIKGKGVRFLRNLVGRTGSASARSAGIGRTPGLTFTAAENGSEHGGEFRLIGNRAFENHILEFDGFLFDTKRRIGGDAEFGFVSGIVGGLHLDEIGKSESPKSGRHGLFKVFELLTGTYEFYEHGEN